MAYAQWVVITVQAANGEYHIKNARLDFGKFYTDGDKNKEIKPSTVNEMVAMGGKNAVIESCGREESPSGTEGSFELHDGGTVVGIYYWDCPWGSKTNISTWTSRNENYVVQQSGANLDSGALGNVTLKVAKFAAM